MFEDEEEEEIPAPTDPVNSADFLNFFTRPSKPTSNQSISSPTKRSKAKADARAKTAKLQKSLARSTLAPVPSNNPPFKPPGTFVQPPIDQFFNPNPDNHPDDHPKSNSPPKNKHIDAAHQ
ncbi:hypothetical protein AKO1_002729 [Acrasis kona]|uniref:Uncharacterized protein n=1 Tax=Acrasis kona TaxID=1008807 RepID=A0AAW2YV29_9EUKA